MAKRSLRKSESAVAAGNVALDLCAGVFDELVVLDAGGAGGHAGHAAEAVVHVAAEGLVERRVALRRVLHHVDAAARRVHLFAPEHVGGACGQAEAAVDAVGEECFVGRVMRVEAGGLGGLDVDEVAWLYASEEAAGVEGAVGIESALDLAHQLRDVRCRAAGWHQSGKAMASVQECDRSISCRVYVRVESRERAGLRLAALKRTNMMPVACARRTSSQGRMRRRETQAHRTGSIVALTMTPAIGVKSSLAAVKGDSLGASPGRFSGPHASGHSCERFRLQCRASGSGR